MLTKPRVCRRAELFLEAEVVESQRMDLTARQRVPELEQFRRGDSVG